MHGSLRLYLDFCQKNRKCVFVSEHCSSGLKSVEFVMGLKNVSLAYICALHKYSADMVMFHLHTR